MKMSYLQIAGFIVLLSLSANANPCSGIGSAELYVSAYGVHPACSDECLESNPCLFQDALDIAMADNIDNTIHVIGGYYNLSDKGLEYNISKINKLTIIGENGSSVNLDGGSKQIPLTIMTEVAYAPDIFFDDTGVEITVRNLTFSSGNPSGLVTRMNASDLLLENNRFEGNGNTINTFGGGADLYNVQGTVTLSNNIFRYNNGFKGAGVFVNKPGGTLLATGNEFTGYRADIYLCADDGAGLYAKTVNGTLKIGNNIFMLNNAAGNGGAIYAEAEEAGSEIAIMNNTIINNASNDKGGGIYAKSGDDTVSLGISNNIVWNNTSGGVGADIAVENNGNLYGSEVYMENNIYGGASKFSISFPSKLTELASYYVNPRLTGFIFLPDGRQTLRPLIGSPAINSASACAIAGWLTTDYEGNPRDINHNKVNIGAVEAIVNPLPPVYYFLLN